MDPIPDLTLETSTASPTALLPPSHTDTDSTTTAQPKAPTEIKDRPRQPRWRHAGSISSDKVSMGKGIIARGWGMLQPEILRTIITHTLDTIPVDEILLSTMNSPHAREIMIMLLKREWLLRLRLISKNWKLAVNSHPVWLDYLQVMSSDFTIPQSFASIAPLALARYATRRVCTICVLHGEDWDVQGIPVLNTKTVKFGSIIVCDEHSELCAICLRLAMYVDGMSVDGEVSDDEDTNMILCMGSHEFDENDDPLPAKCSICAHCRRFILWRRLADELVVNMGRGATVLPYLPRLERTPAYAGYIEEVTAMSYDAAKDVLEEAFLWSHTVYTTAIWDALKLQRFFLRLRIEWASQGHPMTIYMIDEWKRLQRKLWGERLWTKERENEEWNDFSHAYQSWFNEELLLRDVLGSTGYWREDEPQEEKEDNIKAIRLESYWRSKLVNVCCADWAATRIQNGWWVAPSDELAQVKSRAHNIFIHSPFPDMARHLAEPGPPQSYQSLAAPKDMLQAGFGVLRQYPYAPPSPIVPPGETGPSPTVTPEVLPTERLAKLLDKHFFIRLEAVVSSPMWQVAEYVLASNGGNEDLAERVCKAWSIPKVLEALGETSAWIKGECRAKGRKEWAGRRQMLGTGGGLGGLGKVGSMAEGESTQGVGERSQLASRPRGESKDDSVTQTLNNLEAPSVPSKTTDNPTSNSPRIEIVLDDDADTPHMVDYGIEEVDSEPELEIELVQEQTQAPSRRSESDHGEAERVREDRTPLSTESGPTKKRKCRTDDGAGVDSAEIASTDVVVETEPQQTTTHQSVVPFRSGSGSGSSEVSSVAPLTPRLDGEGETGAVDLDHVAAVSLAVVEDVHLTAGELGHTEVAVVLKHDVGKTTAHGPHRNAEVMQATSSDVEDESQPTASSSPSPIVSPTRLTRSTMSTRSRMSRMSRMSESEETEATGSSTLDADADQDEQDEEDEGGVGREGVARGEKEEDEEEGEEGEDEEGVEYEELGEMEEEEMDGLRDEYDLDGFGGDDEERIGNERSGENDRISINKNNLSDTASKQNPGQGLIQQTLGQSQVGFTIPIDTAGTEPTSLFTVPIASRPQPLLYTTPHLISAPTGTVPNATSTGSTDSGIPVLTSSTGSATVPSIPLPQPTYTLPISAIPRVPPPTTHLGPLVYKVLDECWYNAREDLRECKCRICERAKRKQVEALRGVLEGNKRVKLE